MGLTTALLERTFSKRLRCCVTFSVVNTNRESSEGYAGFSPQHYGRDGRCGCPGGRGAVGGGTARLLSPASRPCRHRPPPGLTFFARTEGRGRRATAASPRCAEVQRPRWGDARPVGMGRDGILSQPVRRFPGGCPCPLPKSPTSPPNSGRFLACHTAQALCAPCVPRAVSRLSSRSRPLGHVISPAFSP